jgi:hypothetical protein
MVAICIKYCYVLLINLYYIPNPPFLLHAILETALTHLRSKPSTDDNSPVIISNILSRRTFIASMKLFLLILLMQIWFSRLGRWQQIHVSHIIAGLRRLGLDGSSFKGLPKLAIFKTMG